MNDKNDFNFSDDKNDIEVLDVKGVIKTFKIRKWWFAGTFIIILILTLLFSFYINQNSQYTIKSQLKFSTKNDDYQAMLVSLYPEDSANLWLNLTDQEIPYYLNVVVSQIRDSGTVINEMNKSLGLNLSDDELLKLIRFDIEDEESKLIIMTYSDDFDTAKKINENLINIFKNNMKDYFNTAYNGLLLKIEDKILVDQSEIQKLSKEAEDYVNSNNRKLFKDISKSAGSDKIINFTASSFIPPELQNKVNVATKEYNKLVSVKKDMTENQDKYVNRFSVDNLPEIEKNKFSLADILISIFIAIFAGIIMVHIVDFIYIKRKK
jgi:hypothetical protein